MNRKRGTPRPTDSQTWPTALAMVFVALLVWYMVYTAAIVRSRDADVQITARIYAAVQEGILSEDRSGEQDALADLQELLVDLGVPLVVTSGDDGRYIGSVNLPFEIAVPPTAADTARILRYTTEQLDARNDPVAGSVGGQLVHYGITPEEARLRWIPFLWGAGMLLTVLLAVSVFRYQRRTAAEQAWTSMARELAHQLGTPISSLQGWVELLGLERDQRPGDMAQAEIATAIGDDLVRLERVSRRFELIGRDPALRSVSLKQVVDGLRSYMEVRLPRLGPGVALHVDVPDDLPEVQGHEVLLTWALENVVKNALDAMAGDGRVDHHLGSILRPPVGGPQDPGHRARRALRDPRPPLRSRRDDQVRRLGSRPHPHAAHHRGGPPGPHRARRPRGARRHVPGPAPSGRRAVR